MTRQPGAAMPPAGIRSYGVGADRLDIEREAVPEQRAAVESLGEAWLSGPPVNLAGLTRKISGSPMAGSVTGFRVSPNGAIAVFIADKDTLGRFELYSAPVNGSTAPVKLSAGLPFGSGDAGVAAFQISPDSARVVFLADPNTGGGVNEIFSAPIDGSAAPVRLNTAGAAPVTAFGITPDSARAVFFGTDTAFGSGAVELYRAAIGTASSAVQLSDVGQGNPQGDVVSADFSPDSARAIYAADATADDVFQWHSVPLAAAGPGSDVQLSTALQSVSLVRVSPDSSRVVYTGDENVLNRMEVFVRPIGGGARVQLNPSMAGDGATEIRISPDGTRVAYLADQHTAGVNEVYSAQMLVGGSGTRLNVPMSGTQFADTLTISPDSTTAVYEADQNTPGTYELYRAPMNAGAGPSTLHAVTPPGNAGSFQGLGTPIIGKRVVYPVFGATVDLFSVPFDGTASFTQVNGTLAAGETLFNVFVPAQATRLMAYGSGPASGSATTKIVSAAIRSDLPAEQFNQTAAAGARGVLGYEITSDQAYGVYLQDQDTAGKPELYSRELDSDADGVVNVSDNCPFIVNPSQGSLVFPATVVAVSNTSFTWNQSLDARFARGPLASVGSLATDATGTLIEAAGHVDPANPAVGSGWYYLFAIDCPGRSYQTTPGAEPGRDLAGLP
ncbi:MAG TPA: thrombospondin type 3 repeat-containing protein [Candidatus Polarisedimenticolia bacterium]|nr:thrombospondin type 3 repeat-containing protein [Candidatus Polarisedimenticolia bacterium]